MSGSIMKRAAESAAEDPIARAKRQALERAKLISQALGQTASPAADTPTLPSSHADVPSTNNIPGFNNVHGYFEERVLIPQNPPPGVNFIGLIIGPKAQTLRDLQTRTQCSIQLRGRGMNLDASGNDPYQHQEQHVHISGKTKEQVENARRIIADILNDPMKAEQLRQSQMAQLGKPNSTFENNSNYNNYSNVQSNSGKTTKVMAVPSNMAGAVIGRGGEQIKFFMSSTGAHIQIDNSPENKMKPMRDFHLQGTSDQIARAEQAINEFIRSRDQRPGAPSSGSGMPTNMNMMSNSNNFNQSSNAGSGAMSYPCKMRLEVPDNKVGLIIGKQGKTISKIQTQFRCKIDIPTAADEGNPHIRTLTVGAYSEIDLENAKNDIFNVITYGVPGSASTPMNAPYAMPMQNTTFPGAVYGQQMPMMPNSLPGMPISYNTPQYQYQSIPSPVSIAANITPNNVTTIAVAVIESSMHLLSKTAIAAIEQSTGCKLGVPDYIDSGSNPPQRTITLTGNPSQNQNAINEITEIVTSEENNGDDENGNDDTIEREQKDEQVETNNTDAPAQRYTKAQWQQWRQYYLQIGQPDIGEDAPMELRTQPYE